MALYVSDTVDNGVKNMRRNLEHRWLNSEWMQKMVPTASFTESRWAFENIEGRSLVVKGYGAATGVRGVKEKGKRPQLAVLDDLLGDRDARSDVSMEAINEVVGKAVTFALHPKRNMIIWCGTPHKAGDPLVKAVESGKWHAEVYPVCEAFPCEREDFRSSWPDRFDWEYVSKASESALALGEVSFFNQELMLRIASEEDRLVQDGEIRWYKRSSVLEMRSSYNWYVTTDFAVSERQSADLSVIMVWAYSNGGDWLLVDGMVSRQTMAENMDALFRLVQAYSPVMEVGVEVSGQQQGFVDWIQRTQADRNLWFNLASENNRQRPGIRPVTNKLARFNVILPQIKAGKVMLPEEMRETALIREVVSELSLASMGGFRSRHDDCLDALSMLASLNPYKPGEASAMVEGDDGVWSTDENEEDPGGMKSYVV